MSRKRSYRLLPYFILIFLMAHCVEPYTSPDFGANTDFLVVDAFLNASEGAIQVKLSRSIPLTETNTPPAETGATILLEDNEGSSQALTETDDGRYSLSGIAVDFTRMYRIHIVTASGREYTSDFVEVTVTPPIDSLFWVPTEQGVNVLINAHDDTGNTRFYQWNYTETYEYNAVFFSPYIYENGSVRSRQSGEYYYTCWKTEPSPSILITSTQQLTEDIVYQFPITFIPAGSQKLFQRYSILVKQRAITKEAYSYYKQLKSSTEELGGLFDPQPGQITGNFSSVDNPKEVVLGFFNGSTVHEQRFFIKRSDLPSHLVFYQQQGDCYLEYIDLAGIGAYPRDTHDLVSGVYENITLIGYEYSTKACTDCRLQGGVNVEPDFW